MYDIIICYFIIGNKISRSEKLSLEDKSLVIWGYAELLCLDPTSCRSVLISDTGWLVLIVSGISELSIVLTLMTMDDILIITNFCINIKK